MNHRVISGPGFVERGSAPRTHRNFIFIRQLTFHTQGVLAAEAGVRLIEQQPDLGTIPVMQPHDVLFVVHESARSRMSRRMAAVANTSQDDNHMPMVGGPAISMARSLPSEVKTDPESRSFRSIRFP